MPELAFTKAHGAGNDFLMVERSEVERCGVPESEIPGLARRICSRRFGVGADGLEVVSGSALDGAVAKAHLWNSDGTEAEISGNGTRCVAAYLAERGSLAERFLIETGAGPREVERVSARAPDFVFRMTSGEADCRVLDDSLDLDVDGARHRVTAVDVGNPQCVLRVESLDFDWRSLGRLLERHPRFRDGSNVSFVRVAAEGGGALEVRFWERGAGATLSSGTGCLGAAVAARHHGWIDSAARVSTPGGNLRVDWDGGIGLTGPARIIARGQWCL